MGLADLFMPSGGLPELKPYERQMWTSVHPVAVPSIPETIRERAYRLARQDLPDAPVEDVMCRAEKIAQWLSSGEPQRS